MCGDDVCLFAFNNERSSFTSLHAAHGVRVHHLLTVDVQLKVIVMRVFQKAAGSNHLPTT